MPSPLHIVGAINRKVVIMSPMKVLNVSSPLTLAHIQSKKIRLNSLPISIFSDTTASGEVQTVNESDRVSNAGFKGQRWFNAVNASTVCSTRT